jgi:subtilase family serine protease
MGRRTTAAALVAGLMLAGAPLAMARAAAPVTLAGAVPGWAVGAGRAVPADETVGVQLVLPWRDRAGAMALVRSVSDPASPHYRDYASATTFRSRFAPSAADVDAVASWLRAAGLEVGRVPANRMYVPARGPAVLVAKAFGVGLMRYDVHGVFLRAPDRAPTLPADIARRVVGVSGLAELPIAVPDPLPVAVPEEPATPADSAPPAALVYAKPCSAYHGALVQRSLPPAIGKHQPAVTCETSIANQRAEYAANRRGIDGTGQTVVIVGSHAIPRLTSDVIEWSKRRGLPTLRSGQLQQISYPSAYQTPVAEPVLRPEVWALQAHMLVENLHAMAPGADLVYLGTTSSLDLPNGTTLAVDAGLGDIVMNGWYTAGENTNQAEIAQINQTAQQAAATGISLLFASGSIGDNSSQGSKPSPEYPANDPLVTAVGATSLIVGRGGSRREVGWAKTSATLKDGDWDDDARNTFRGSGGGTSAVNAQPDYQRGVVPTRLSRRTDGSFGRAVPDVAVNGDAETGIVIGLTQHFPDGTDRYAERRHASDESATAVFAALLALANQAAGKDLGFVNPAMYALHAKGAFRDIVPSGSLGAGVRTEYVDGATPAKGTKSVLKAFEQYESNAPARGYDTSTGLGSPSARWLALLSGH